MREVNIKEEIEYLADNQNTDFFTKFTDGVAVRKSQFSAYITECHALKESTCGIHGDISYWYCIDLNNNSLVLFTEVSYDDYDGTREDFDLDEEYFYVEIYASRDDFMGGQLASCLQDATESSAKWGYDEEGWFFTDDEWYNDIEMIKDAELLLTHEEMENSIS
jgi:hypothetical protein